MGVFRWRAIRAYECGAVVGLVETREGFIDAEIIFFIVIGEGENKGIASNKGRDITAFPIAIGTNEGIFAIAHAKEEDGNDGFLIAGKDDGVIGEC